MNFFRQLFAPSPFFADLKYEDYFSLVSIPNPPQDPEADAIYQTIREDLKVLPLGYRHSDAIIELTEPARDAIIRLQEDLAFYRATYLGAPFSPPIERDRFRLYGIEVRVVDQIPDGRNVRILYTFQ